MTTTTLHVSTKVITCVWVSIKREIFDKSKVQVVDWYLPPAWFVLDATHHVVNDVEMWNGMVDDDVFWLDVCQFTDPETVVPETHKEWVLCKTYLLVVAEG